MNASDTIPTGLRPIWRSTKGYLQLIATWLKFRKHENYNEAPWKGSKYIAQGIALGISALPIYTPWKGKRLYTHQILLHFQRDFTKSTFTQGDALG